MNLNFLAKLILIGELISAAMPLSAQSSLSDRYDTKRTVILEGSVIRLWFAPNTPFWIVMETNKAETKQRWVVVGNSMAELRSAGWVFAPPPAGTLNINDKIAVAVHLPKSGSRVADELAAASPQIAEELKTARLAHGTEITLPSSKKVMFGARQ